MARPSGLLRPVGPVAREHDLVAQVDARLPPDRGTHPIAQATHVRGAATLVVDEEVGVLLAHPGAALAGTLEAHRFDEPPRRITLGIAEGAARRRHAQRLMRLAP